MAIVRVIIWDEQNYLQRISTPEDTFLIESIDASGSDSNVLKIGPMTASMIVIGSANIATYVSGVLSGNFITGTFYGDGSQLRGLVTTLNQFTGSIQLVAGTNITITSGTNPNQITISAATSASVGVSSLNSFTGSIQLVSGPNITINSGSGQIVISGTTFTSTSSFNSFTASINNFTSSINGFTSSFSSSVKSIGDTRYVFTSSFDPFSASINQFTQSVNSFTSSFSSSVKSIGDTRYITTASFSIKAGPNINVNSSSFEYSVSGTATSLNGYSGSIQFNIGPNLTFSSASGIFSLSGTATSINGYSGSVVFNSSSDFLKITSSSNGNITLTASHKPIDQLVHNIAETSFDEYTYNSPSQISGAITWTNTSKTTKIRQEIYTYSGVQITSSLSIQYNANGVEVERVLEVYHYVTGTQISTIDRTYT